MKRNRVEAKAERLVAMYVLDQEDLLRGLTQQEIADLFGYRNRSTGLRLLRSVKRMRVNVLMYRDRAIALHVLKREQGVQGF